MAWRTHFKGLKAWLAEKKRQYAALVHSGPAQGQSKKCVLVVIPHDKSWWGINATQQFVSTLRDQTGYSNSPEIDIVSAQASYELLHAFLITAHREHKYDLVVSMGTWVAREVQEFLDGIADPPSHIFCGALEPAALGIVDSMEFPGRRVSGIATMPPDFGLQVDMFQALLPSVKAIGVLFGMAVGANDVCLLVQKQIDRFKQACLQHGITLVPLPVAQASSISSVVSRAIEKEGIGLLCTLNDLFVSSNMELIIETGKALHIPICASELSSVYYGAALGFGDYGAVYGLYGASLAYEVLVRQCNLATIPVIVPPIQQSLRYNHEAMLAQGIVLTPQVRHLLNMVSVFFNAKQ